MCRKILASTALLASALLVVEVASEALQIWAVSGSHKEISQQGKLLPQHFVDRPTIGTIT
jgi:hypothetical protein